MATKKIFFLCFIGIFVFLNVSSFSMPSKEKQERPNILLFLADDMTWRDCQPYGNNDVLTPNMSRLAGEGMCFDNMFTSTAMCAPTRQQLYTGLFPVRSGAYPNHSRVYDGVKSLGHHFGELGYRVALLGKKHYGPAESYPIESLGRASRKGLDVSKIQPVLNQGGKPFFMIVAASQPHKPWNTGPHEYYWDKELTIPEYMVDCRKTHEDLTRYYAEITFLDSLLGRTLDHLKLSGKEDNTIVIFTSEQGSSFPMAKWTCYDLGLKTAFIARWPGKIQAGTRTAAMTQYVDVVPTLLEAAGGSPPNVHTGIEDNGGYTGFDGQSFLNVMVGKKQEHRDYTYGVHTTRGIISGSVCYPVRSVRSKQFKYIINLNSSSPFYNLAINRRQGIYGAWLEKSSRRSEKHRFVERYTYRPKEELYNIQDDPWEMNNLADDPAYSSLKKKLGKELHHWMEQQGDQGIDTELKAIERQGRTEEQWRSHEENINRRLLEGNK